LFACGACPPNSFPSSDNSTCICNIGFNSVNGQCIQSCQTN
jgi:hypothetical protein